MRSMHFLLISRVPKFLCSIQTKSLLFLSIRKLINWYKIVSLRCINNFSYLSTSYFALNNKKNMIGLTEYQRLNVHITLLPGSNHIRCVVSYICVVLLNQSIVVCLAYHLRCQRKVTKLVVYIGTYKRFAFCLMFDHHYAIKGNFMSVGSINYRISMLATSN